MSHIGGDKVLLFLKISRKLIARDLHKNVTEENNKRQLVVNVQTCVILFLVKSLHNHSFDCDASYA